MYSTFFFTVHLLYTCTPTVHRPLVIILFAFSAIRSKFAVFHVHHVHPMQWGKAEPQKIGVHGTAPDPHQIEKPRFCTTKRPAQSEKSLAREKMSNDAV